ncbi:MAG: methyltransferase domain-containing protein [bacterium]|nr:methyltransferase domain-containing protein [bacterium]
MFQYRSTQKELLDEEQIPKQDLYRNLFELNQINSLLGGHAVTLNALKQLKLVEDKTYRILDIGCGGGDTLMAIAKWGRKNNLQLQLIGVDLKADCIHYATEFCANYPEISFVQSDYAAWLQKQSEVDISISSLFCHHLPNQDIANLMRLGAELSSTALIINDLHRHPLAYYSIAFLTKLFSKSYLVKNDAKLSVLRGFTRKEIQQILPPNYSASLKWKWAFRWQITIYKCALGG